MKHAAGGSRGGVNAAQPTALRTAAAKGWRFCVSGRWSRRETEDAEKEAQKWRDWEARD